MALKYITVDSGNTTPTQYSTDVKQVTFDDLMVGELSTRGYLKTFWGSWSDLAEFYARRQTKQVLKEEHALYRPL